MKSVYGQRVSITPVCTYIHSLLTCKLHKGTIALIAVLDTFMNTWFTFICVLLRVITLKLLGILQGLGLTKV